jgi:cytochrome P450
MPASSGDRVAEMSLPAGPRGPAWAQTLRFMRDPLAFLERCLARYGDVFTIRFLGYGNLVYTTDPEAIKEIFTGDGSTFQAGRANEVLEPVLGARSVLLLDEDAHLHQRRLLLPSFHGESVRRYGELMHEIAEREAVNWPRGRPIAMRPRMQSITLEVILRAVFGINEAERLAHLRTLIPPMLATSNAIVWMPWLRREFPFGPWRRFVRARAQVDEIIYDEIRHRRGLDDLGERDDVLSLLLAARDENGVAMTDGELRDELVTLLVAGHETTAIGLAWALERLARNPAVLDRLHAELDQGDETYLDAVVKETLRSRTVVFDVARYLSSAVELKGHLLPAGTYVVPAIALVHRLGTLYGDPEAFRPERFLDGQPDPYTWIPFGGGIRRCIGAAFASFEMKVVLATLLGTLTVREAQPQDEPARFRNVTLVPAKGARVIVEDRTRDETDAATGAVAYAA